MLVKHPFLFLVSRCASCHVLCRHCSHTADCRSRSSPPLLLLAPGCCRSSSSSHCWPTFTCSSSVIVAAAHAQPCPLLLGLLLLPSLLSSGCICIARSKGGFGMLDFKTHNEAVLLRNLHKFFNTTNIHWVHFISETCYRNGKLPNHVGLLWIED